jgi:hypothetical protein
MRPTLLLLFSLGISSPHVLHAQGPELAFGTDSAKAMADSVRADSSSLALPPVRQPQAIRALGEIVILNVAAVGINNLARDLPSTRPATWWRNLKGGWIWDPNGISTNNLEHPYGGAVYYNVARANGLSFWTATPMTVAGSLMWELFGEPVQPSINDVVITSLSGVNFGESVRRISDLLLDNQAHGINRVWREALVLLINPGMGVDRLSRGQTWQQHANPADHRPGDVRTEVALGVKRMATTERTGAGIDVAMLGLDLTYGDPFPGKRVQPFSYFTFSMALSSGPSTTINEISTRGMLARVGHRTRPEQPVAGIFMDFEYQYNEQYRFSQQSFGVGVLSRHGGGTWSLHTDLSAELAPLVATSDPYAIPLVDREFDYGTGFGGRALARVQHRGTTILSAGYRGYWTATLNGASRSKFINFVSVEARAPLPFGLAAGAAYNLFLQRSSYDTRTPETSAKPSLSLFVSTTGR